LINILPPRTLDNNATAGIAFKHEDPTGFIRDFTRRNWPLRGSQQKRTEERECREGKDALQTTKMHAVRAFFEQGVTETTEKGYSLC
jgi:hypothetical protein